MSEKDKKIILILTLKLDSIRNLCLNFIVNTSNYFLTYDVHFNNIQISSKSSRKKSARKSPEAQVSPDAGEDVVRSEPKEGDIEEEVESTQHEEESEEEDVTEAESMEEDEELHDGYAIKQGKVKLNKVTKTY